jgi:hypothetical protein
MFMNIRHSQLVDYLGDIFELEPKYRESTCITLRYFKQCCIVLKT